MAIQTHIYQPKVYAVVTQCTYLTSCSTSSDFNTADAGNLSVGRYSVVSTATHCGLDGLGIEYRCGVRFFATVQTDPGAHPTSYPMGTPFFPRVKRPGRGVYHLPPSSAEVNKNG